MDLCALCSPSSVFLAKLLLQDLYLFKSTNNELYASLVDSIREAVASDDDAKDVYLWLLFLCEARHQCVQKDLLQIFTQLTHLNVNKVSNTIFSSHPWILSVYTYLRHTHVSFMH